MQPYGKKRVENSLQISLALTICAMLLYIPAMVYPMMVVTQFGVNLESTIIEGIISFLEHGSYFIAFVIFLASVAIPIVKLFALFFIFLSLRINVKMTNKTKILIYKYIEAIGKWSMIDIYVVALMASIVQLDELFNIKGGVAATSFSLMVIITIFAAHRFDTRIIWDEKRD
ncbi:paraquat-inducible protein A [Aliarcobacter cryaerophilus]|uniref:Paraquat-inducible protein A n=1 Tax=Arcobacter sp. AZ-2023 TaxID=3074453 RepID=A0AA96CVB0_9BACT|nr:paraquat-inducible protein A [Arcobacter sp. AZ-2023]